MGLLIAVWGGPLERDFLINLHYIVIYSRVYILKREIDIMDVKEEFAKMKIRKEPYVKALELRIEYLEGRIKQLSDEIENLQYDL